MITNATSDTTTGQTAVLLTPPDLNGTGTPSSKRDDSADSSSSQGMRGRIHSVADVLHRTIDKVEQSLDSKGQGVMATPAKYGEQAKQYGSKLGDQISARPLQSAGIALAAGIVLHKMLRRAPSVRVVSVPVYAAPSWDSGRSAERRSSRWMDAAGSGLQRLGGAGQHAMEKASAAAGMGMASTKAMTSTLASKASTLPHDMRRASQRLLAKSQDYGSMARSGVQEHPMIGVGTVLGISALLTTLWLQRRSDDSGMSQVNIDGKGGPAWSRISSESRTGIREMASSRPVTFGVLALGVGALIGAMLKQR